MITPKTLRGLADLLEAQMQGKTIQKYYGGQTGWEDDEIKEPHLSHNLLDYLNLVYNHSLRVKPEEKTSRERFMDAVALGLKLQADYYSRPDVVELHRKQIQDATESMWEEFSLRLAKIEQLMAKLPEQNPNQS